MNIDALISSYLLKLQEEEEKPSAEKAPSPPPPTEAKEEGPSDVEKQRFIAGLDLSNSRFREGKNNLKWHHAKVALAYIAKHKLEGPIVDEFLKHTERFKPTKRPRYTGLEQSSDEETTTATPKTPKKRKEPFLPNTRGIKVVKGKAVDDIHPAIMDMYAAAAGGSIKLRRGHIPLRFANVDGNPEHTSQEDIDLMKAHGGGLADPGGLFNNDRNFFTYTTPEGKVKGNAHFFITQRLLRKVSPLRGPSFEKTTNSLILAAVGQAHIHLSHYLLTHRIDGKTLREHLADPKMDAKTFRSHVSRVVGRASTQIIKGLNGKKIPVTRVNPETGKHETKRIMAYLDYPDDFVFPGHFSVEDMEKRRKKYAKTPIETGKPHVGEVPIEGSHELTKEKAENPLHNAINDLIGHLEEPFDIVRHDQDYMEEVQTRLSPITHTIVPRIIKQFGSLSQILEKKHIKGLQEGLHILLKNLHGTFGKGNSKKVYPHIKAAADQLGLSFDEEQGKLYIPEPVEPHDKKVAGLSRRVITLSQVGGQPKSVIAREAELERIKKKRDETLARKKAEKEARKADGL